MKHYLSYSILFPVLVLMLSCTSDEDEFPDLGILENELQVGESVTTPLNDGFESFDGNYKTEEDGQPSLDHYAFNMGFTDGVIELVPVPVPPNVVPNKFLPSPGSKVFLEFTILVPRNEGDLAEIKEGNYQDLNNETSPHIGEKLIFGATLSLDSDENRDFANQEPLFNSNLDIQTTTDLADSSVIYTLNFSFITANGTPVKGNYTGKL